MEIFIAFNVQRTNKLSFNKSSNHQLISVKNNLQKDFLFMYIYLYSTKIIIHLISLPIKIKVMWAS